jgi:phosphodiesterase/alkaline phosphatase D-like protein
MAATAVALAAPGSAMGANPFTNGVTAGEVTASSALIWGQTKKDGTVQAQVAKDGAFQHIVARARLKATKTEDDAFRTKVRKLDSGRTFHYRFCKRGKCSDKGVFQTAPKPGQAKTIKFAYSGDESAQPAVGQDTPFWGQFKAFKSMAAEHNNFNMDFGDTIYSDPEVDGAPTALSVHEKWKMYRAKLGIKNQRTIREATGLYNHWDDHEFINDFSKAENGVGIYRAGVRAFRTYEPVTYSKHDGIYRTFRWGKNLEVFFLDLRSFRSAKASANGVCDNTTTGQPDLAPTAPQSTRNVFGLVIPSSGLSDTVDPACLAAINDPTRTMLGSAQYAQFMQDVTDSTATWKVVMTEDPIQQYYALPYDRWEGYAHERVQLLSDLEAANVDHLAFMTTDTHAGLQNVVRYRTLEDDSAPANAPVGTPPLDTAYQDFVIGPVATKPFWQEIDDATGGSGNGALISAAFFKPAPPSGVGMGCAQGGQNSYAEVTVKSDELKVEYKDENGDQLLDADGSTPCGPYILTG